MKSSITHTQHTPVGDSLTASRGSVDKLVHLRDVSTVFDKTPVAAWLLVTIHRHLLLRIVVNNRFHCLDILYKQSECLYISHLRWQLAKFLISYCS